MLKRNRKNQLRLWQGDDLLQLIRDEWYSVSMIKDRLRQIHLTSLAREGVRVQFVAVQVRNSVSHEQGTNRQIQRNQQFLNFQLLSREISGNRKGIYPFNCRVNPSMMYFLLVVKKGEKLGNKVVRFVHELQWNIVDRLKLESRISIGEKVKGLKNLKDGYASCLLAWNRNATFQDGFGRHKEIPEIGSLYSSEEERSIIQAIGRLDIHNLRHQLEVILSRDRSMHILIFLALRILLLFSCVTRKYEFGSSSLQKYIWNCQMNLTDYQTREELISRMEELALLVMEEVKKTRFSGGLYLLESVRKYVKQNFTNPLTIPLLAAKFNMNEICLAGQFKRYMGVSLSKYVTRLRVAKAEQLLQENQLKLNDISKLLGYPNSKGFAPIFKKTCGKSLEEYRDRYCTRNIT